MSKGTHVKFLKDGHYKALNHSCVPAKKGDVVKVDERVAQLLIKNQSAEATEAPAPKKKKKEE